MSWRNLWVILSLTVGQVAYSYQAAIIGTTLAQPSFILYMGLANEQGIPASNVNTLTGSMSGVFQVSKQVTRFCHVADGL